MAESEEQIAEYKAQLASIEELLQASPDDESLLSLKKDLVELLQITAGPAASTNEETPQPSNDEPAPEESYPELPMATAAVPASGEEGQPTETTNASADPPKKKRKKEALGDFVVPPHLITNEQDTEAEKKRKRRALKALKSQHREKRKEYEHEKKQKSWKSFQKKSGGAGAGSMFRTQESVNDRVGVLSKKQKTEFGQRTRHTKQG
eukprot:Nitzschia sp. Nitz4//scaffold82_size85912//9436//10056//NITZ4_005125-RA/size85912-processed-gene-0.22-mRNA-1//-1//CDS//3329558787//5615//frame0